MNSEPNTRIVGAFIVGFALVAGAYTISSIKTPRTYPVAEQQATVGSAVTQRTAITVLDEDNNGIEDWRDEFVTTEPIFLDNTSAEDYELPTTLTGKLGINFMQDIIRAKQYGDFGRSEQEVIDDTIKALEIETSHELYDVLNIKIMREWTDDDIRNYANLIANAIVSNDVPGVRDELLILQDILNRKDESRFEELETLANVFKNTRDDTLAVPVPAFLVKEHLDLINTYHAVHTDIAAMQYSFEDPTYTLLRLKRYEEDSLGLYYALQNMYRALIPYAHLFESSDPAVLFVTFSQNVQNN